MVDHQHILAGRDIPADRQIPLRRNRDVVQPRQFFLARCSSVSPTHDNFFHTTDFRFAEPVFSRLFTTAGLRSSWEKRLSHVAPRALGANLPARPTANGLP